MRTRKAGTARWVAGFAGLLLGASGVGPLAVAGEAVAPPSPGMRVADLVALAWRDNATLAAARAQWEAMQEAPVVERALPNPMFFYGAMDRTDRFPGGDEQRFKMEQTVPWPGKRGLKGRIAEQDAARMGFDYEAMRREIAMQVREGYYDLCATRKSRGILEIEESVLKQLTRVAESRYSAGEVSQQDVAKAQAEITMVRARRLELEAQETTLTARLNTLLNRPADAALSIAVEPPPRTAPVAPASLPVSAETNRPEVMASQTLAERSRLQEALMRKEYLPDVTVGVEYRRFEDEDDMAMVMIGIDLPIWLRRNAAGVREAAKQLASNRAAVEAARRAAQFDARDAAFKLQTAQRTLELYEKELVPQAERRFTASDAGYRAGKVDFMDLLESERFLLNARLMQVMAEGSLGMQQARLERASGPGAGGE